MLSLLCRQLDHILHRYKYHSHCLVLLVEFLHDRLQSTNTQTFRTALFHHILIINTQTFRMAVFHYILIINTQTFMMALFHHILIINTQTFRMAVFHYILITNTQTFMMAVFHYILIMFICVKSCLSREFLKKNFNLS